LTSPDSARGTLARYLDGVEMCGGAETSLWGRREKKGRLLPQFPEDETGKV